jgi:hypothetical protein
MQEWLDWIHPSSTFDAIGPMPEGYELKVVDLYGAKVLAVDTTGIKPPLCFDFRLRKFHPLPEALWHVLQSGAVHG